MIPQHLSKTQEHYTPAHIVELAREVLGGIDLDPASCLEANATVKAWSMFDREADGLSLQWRGRVFLNPPGGTFTARRKNKTDPKPVTPPIDAAYKLKFGTDSRAVAWWRKLAMEHESGSVTAAVFVGFSLDILQAAQCGDVAGPLAHALCVPSKRLCFGGDQPTHGNVIVYLGPKRELFRRVFSSVGEVRT